MKKALLSLAAMALAISANAQGIAAVGANVIIAPSSYWDGSQTWDAWTYVINSGADYGDWSTDNPNYNVLCGDEPADDSNGKNWTEVGYNPEDEATIGDNMFTGEEILWEQHTSPFSSDDSYRGGTTTYKWTTSSVMADIYLRRSFTTTSVLPNDVYLACGHDDAPCEYYINGVLVFSKDGDPAAGNGWNEGEFVKLTDEQKALIKKDGSENILAVHVHQNWGGALADCGLYTSVPGGVDMGYVTPWTGKTIFNSFGGYANNGSSAFRNAGGMHEWEALYEAMPGDAYTLHMTTESYDQWGSQLHFKSAITLDESKTYTLKFKLTPTCDIDQVTVKVCDRENDEAIAYDDEIALEENTTYEFEEELYNVAIPNFKLVFDFCMGYKNNDVVISDISLTDEDGKEYWIGTQYFNYMYFTNEDGNQVKSPKLTGRTESKAWTNVDFDDSMWDDTAMPIGNQGYMSEVQTIWPGHLGHLDYAGDGGDGDNTGYWIRRTFTLNEINPSLEYLLNVCHDDDYETYVNGHLLQTNTGWTNGKNPVQVHIKASYLNVGENVIATEIHQNWGGRFYDCGINVVEFNYEEVVATANQAIANAESWEGDLTEAMRAEYDQLVADARAFIATELDGAEIKNYINDTFANEIKRIQNYSGTVTAGRELLAAAKLDTADWKGELQAKLAECEGFEECKTADAVNNLVSPIKNARKRAHAERRANTFTGSAVAAGDYYIYNVGEQQFLGAGENWGTHLALEYASNAMTLIPSDVENGYVIETYRPNGNIGEADFANYGGYIDTGNQDVWVFVPVEGKQNVYNIRRNGENGENGVYLGYRGGDNQNGYSWNVVDSDMRTAELESNQWMLITKAELDAQAEKATATAAVDMTHLIVNPGFDQRLTIDNWENIGAIWGRNNNYPDFIHENWNSGCGLAQNIVDDALVEGWYTMEVQGYYRQGTRENHAALLEAGEEIESQAIFYAADEETTLKLVHENNAVIPYTLNSTYVYNGVRCPDYPTDAAEAFEHGAYKNVLKFELTDAGELYFGIETPEPADDSEYGKWTVVDNFRLKYWGTEEPTDEATAISEVATDNTVASKGIYNLQGQKLQKAVKGINIINGRKVVIK